MYKKWTLSTLMPKYSTFRKNFGQSILTFLIRILSPLGLYQLSIDFNSYPAEQYPVGPLYLVPEQNVSTAYSQCLNQTAPTGIDKHQYSCI